MSFAGKIVLVTGAARGIGAACADTFAQRGATVIRTDKADADLTIKSQVDQLFARVVAEHGRLDVLIANAGVPYSLTTTSATDTDWDECLNINLRSVWWTASAALPLLRAAHGNIVTIASYQGLHSGRSSFPYSAAKGGLLALTRSMAVEYAPDVRVNAIIPGQIESVRTDAYFHKFTDPEAARARVLQSFPLRRLGRPEDIAKAACFLASDDAEWITGTFLMVDGGRDAATLDLSDLERPVE
jgi:NAD(P)-dependent dehydrogenase (short-subunit alcohol dehydrogenase family)